MMSPYLIMPYIHMKVQNLIDENQHGQQFESYQHNQRCVQLAERKITKLGRFEASVVGLGQILAGVGRFRGLYSVFVVRALPIG